MNHQLCTFGAPLWVDLIARGRERERKRKGDREIGRGREREEK